MRSKIYFLFLLSFIFLIYLLSFVASAPSQVASMPGRTIAFPSSYSINYQNFFRDFTSYSFNYTIDGVPFANAVQETAQCSRMPGIVRICVGENVPIMTIQNLGLGYYAMNITFIVTDGTSVFVKTPFILGSSTLPNKILSMPSSSKSPGNTTSYSLENYFNNFNEICMQNTFNGTNGSKNCITGGTLTETFPTYLSVEMSRDPVDASFSLTYTALSNVSSVLTYFEVKNPKGSAYQTIAFNVIPALTTLNSSGLSPPLQMASFINSFTLAKDQILDLYVSNFFTNFTTTSLAWEDDVLLQTVAIQTSKTGNTSCVTGEFYVCISPTSDNSDLHISIKGLGYNTINPFFWVVSNPNGLVDTSFIVTSTSASSSSSIGGNSSSISTPVSGGLISGPTTAFLGLFPDSDTLSMRQKFGAVVVSMFILAILLIVGVFATMRQFPKPMIYLLLFLEIALFIFFISIQYINIGVLIVAVLVLLVLIFLLKRGG